MADKYKFCFARQLLDHIKFFRNNEVKLMLDEKLAKRSDGVGTLLHRAAFYDNVEIVQRLIELGCDVDFPGEGGKTALMVAVQNERLATVKILLEVGAKVDIEDAGGNSALNMVFHENYFDTAIIEAFVLKVKAVGNQILSVAHQLGKYGCAPHHAIVCRHLDTIRYLLELYCEKLCQTKESNVAILPDLAMTFICLQAKPHLAPTILRNRGRMSMSFGKVHLLREGKVTFQDILVYADHSQTQLIKYGILPEMSSNFSYLVSNGSDDTPLRQLSHGIHSLIAHLVMLEKLGTSIFEFARSFEAAWLAGKIIKMEKYHELCQQILDTTMFRTSTLFDLLTDQQDKLRTYVRNEAFQTIIEQVCSEHQLPEFYLHYYKTLMIRIKRAKQIVELENAAINVICKIFNSSHNKCYHFARQVIGYLNKQELERLCIVCD